MLELLSPCGSPESFHAAINGGADALYLGLDDFSARKNAGNFTRENLKDYLDYAHALGVKIYVALNTLAGESELDDFFSYAEFCSDAGVDGVIVQDMFLGKTLHERFPDLPLHLSTQAGVNNVGGASVAKKFGFSRVVLARETPLSEIKKITKIIEVEAFVQGALCTAFSGQCYLSSFAGNMSGNRGLCKQPCRKRYRITNGNEVREGYLISLADLSVGEKIKEYIDAGVTSFKIEGRMRKPAFVAAATRYYRDVLCGKNPSISPLKRTFNRGDYTRGLAFCQDENFVSDRIQSHKGEFIGKIVSIKNGYAKIASRPLSVGDGGKIIRDGLEVGAFLCDKIGVKVSGSAKIGDEAHITTDVALENDLQSAKRLVTIDVRAELLKGRPARLTARAGECVAEVVGFDALEEAKNAPLSEEQVEKTLKKTEKYPFFINFSLTTNGVFMAVSRLNELRRTLYQNLYAKLTYSPARRKFAASDFSPAPVTAKGVIVLDDVFDFDCKKVDIAVFCPSDYADNEVIDGFFENTAKFSLKRFLYLPNKLSEEDERFVAPLFERFDGLYVDGYYGLALAGKYGKELIVGTGCNVYNPIAAKIANESANAVCLSKELSKKQAEDLNGYIYAAGAIKVMDLLYCPFKKTCATCRRPGLSVLDDGVRKFTLRRVKLNGCRFEVYNSAFLVTGEKERAVVNLLGVDKNKKAAVIEKLGDREKLKELLSPYTSGHENKPLV